MSIPPDTRTTAGAASSAVPDALRSASVAIAHWHDAVAAGAARLSGARSPHVVSLAGEVATLAVGVDALQRAVARAAVEFAAADDVSRVLRVAIAEAGYVEGAVDRTKFGRWYGLDGNPWCAMFVSWAFAQAGMPLPAVDSGKGFARVLDGRRYAEQVGRLVWRPRPGDVFFIDHGRGRGHTGIVVSVDEAAGTMVTIEGNTNAAGSRTGTSVRSRIRPIRQANAGFWRVRGDIAPAERVAPRAARARVRRSRRRRRKLRLRSKRR